MTNEYMHKRQGFWYFIRRVPEQFRAVERRPYISISTRIRIADDPRGVAAAQVVTRMNAAAVTEWTMKLGGQDPGPHIAYSRNVQIATSYRLPYLQAQDVQSLPDREFLRRLDIIKENPTAEVASALMGTVRAPGLVVSELLVEYEKLISASLKTKSAGQLKKWRVERQTKLDLFSAAVGADIELAKLTRDNVLQFRTALNDNILRGKFSIATANKYLGRVAVMFKVVNDARQLGCGNVFDKIAIAGGETGKRVAFEANWVQETLLADGALDGLNFEARCILYLMTETGLRLAEACNLSSTTIKLDHDIPHIQIRAEGRQLKTKQSKRDIPLVGVALMAMKANPNGFPRYHDANASLSGIVVKAGAIIPHGSG